MPEGTAATSLDQLVPVLQSLVGVLEGLIGARHGAGAVAGGGAAMTGAAAAPEAAGTQATAGAAHAGHAHGGGAPTANEDAGDHGSHGSKGSPKGHHGMKILPRDKPVDAARAQQNFNAIFQTFSGHTRAGLDFKNNQTHGYLSAAERNAFRKQFPGLPVPQSLVFPGGSNKPIGVVYRNNEGEFDLGMGAGHVHNDHPDSKMQHIWFTPNHLDFAFSDVESGMTGATAAAMRKLGYKTA